MNPALEIATYTPTLKQGLFHRSPAKFRLLLGAYGSGKTCQLVWEDIMQAMEYPNSHGVVYRKTYPALRDTTFRQYMEECPPELITNHVRTEGREMIVFPNGSSTRFRCLDDFQKLGSTQWDRISIDEASEVDEREFRTLALGRLRGKIGPRRMVLATNPPDDTHYLYAWFVENADADTAVFHLSTYDNAAHLPPGYIQKMEQRMTPQEQKKFLRGEWGVLADGPAVFPAFNEDLHVADLQPIPNRPVLRGWDPGFRRPACVWIQQDAMGHWAVLHELLGDCEDVTRFGTRVMQESHRLFPEGTVFEDYCDVAGTQTHDTGPTFVSVLRRRFHLTPHTRRLGLEKSLQAVRDLLGTLGNGGIPLLRVNRTCRYTKKAFSGGYYIDPKSTTGDAMKDGVYDHIMDAIRYALAPSIQPLRSEFEGRPLPRAWRQAV